MNRRKEILKRIEERGAQVVVFGLGYIGLPTALYYASKGIPVKGLDTNGGMIEDLENGIIRMKERGLEELAQEHLGKIELMSSYESVNRADVCVLCLPSPIDENKKPVIRYLEDSVAQLAKILKRGALILIESTVPVGTTERLAQLFGSVSGLELDKDYWFAHCPERVLPGQVIKEIEANDRLVGGVTETSTELATAFLTTIFNPERVHPTTARVSEAAKLAENAFRDVNIAYANELAKICTGLDIDVTEVIRLANLHPRVSILNPGIGVGGYCLPKDGWLLVESVREKPVQTELIPAARSVNDSMPSHVFERIRQIDHATLSLRRVIGVLGLSFKPNVSDTRNSPSVELIRILISAGLNVIVYDPFVNRDFGAKRADSLDAVLTACEIIVVGVGHGQVIEELRTKDLSQKVIVDPCNVVPDLREYVKQYIGLSK